MKRYLLFFIAVCFFCLKTYAVPVQGGVEKEIVVGKSRVVDANTGEAIRGAKVSMPLENATTFTDENGTFTLSANLNGRTVLLVEKNGYKPYSVTVDKNDLSSPIVLGLEKSSPKDISIESNLFHLGDDNYSNTSANAGQFRVASMGPHFSKNFKIGRILQGSTVNLVIGSIMGVDTKLARDMGQNSITNTYASPPEVYFNGNKIAEIQLNGDGQRVRIPYNLIKQNQNNQLTIRTGKNLMQKAYVDYDDIEIANLSIEIP